MSSISRKAEEYRLIFANDSCILIAILTETEFTQYEQTTKRKAVSELFPQIEQLNPEARHSIWHALEKANKLIEQ